MPTQLPPKHDARLDFLRQTAEERTDALHEAAKKYSARVQSESTAERAKPTSTYAVGRAALDEAMRILGRGNFRNTETDPETDAVNPDGALQ